MTRRTFGQIVSMVLFSFGLRAAPQRLTCPRCGRDAHVVCSNRQCSCWKDIPANELPLKWTPDGEGEECPYCSFAAHADFWCDREMELSEAR